MRVPLAVVAALALLAGALAGCGAPRVGDVTAMQVVGIAQATAREWQADAVLVRLEGPEIRNGTEYAAAVRQGGELTEEEEFHAHVQDRDDGTLGDGKARGWVVVFSSRNAGDDQVLRVFVAADGSTRTLEASEYTSIYQPLEGNWVLDSDAALERARGDPAFRAALAAEPWAVVTVLMSLGLDIPGGPAGRHAVWLVAVEEQPRGKESAIVVVDAVNGTLLDVGEYFRELLPAFLETGSQEVTLTAGRPRMEYGFETLQAHHRLAVAFDGLPYTPPAQHVTLVVTTPDGRSLSFGYTRGIDPFQEPSHLVVEPAPAGAYSVTLQLDPATSGGAYAEGVVSHCTDGHRLTGARHVFACSYAA